MTANFDRLGKATLAALWSVVVCSVPTLAEAQAPSWSASVGTTTTRTHAEDWIGPSHGASESGYVIAGAIRLTEHLAVDLGYMRSDGLNQNVRFSESGPVVGCDLLGMLMYGICFEVRESTVHEGRVVFDASALQASAVGILEIGSRFELYGKGGAAKYRLSGREELVAQSSGQRLTRQVGRNDTGLLAGLGVSAKVTPHWRARLEYQTFWIDEDFVHDRTEASIDTWALMADYRFGSSRNRRRRD